MKTWNIQPITEPYIEGFRQALDSVAREKQYLATQAAPSLEKIQQFVRGNLEKNYPHWIALKADQVIGWCDIRGSDVPSMAHMGVLGMGVIKAFRGQGIGEALLQAVIQQAQQQTFKRIELTVREDNDRAFKLYEKMGFQLEGRKSRGLQIDGQFYDTLLMGLVWD